MLNIIEIYNITEIPVIADDNLILVDIDDTIITPKSNLFRYNSKYRNIIDKLKENTEANLNCQEIVSIWRLNRKVMLIEQEWKKFIEKFYHQIFALTKMDIGKFGYINSVEAWRYNELKNLGIKFKKSFNGIDNFIIGKNNINGSFDQGIFYTGQLTKGDILTYIHQVQPISKLVFIDDKVSNLEDIMATCKKLNIDCDLYLYNGINTITGDVDKKIADNMVYNLINNQIWQDEV